MAASEHNMIEVRDLKMHFKLGGSLFGRAKATLKAVDGLSFSIRKGETLGLVGESGCGKTTVGRCITRLYQPTSGSIRFRGAELSTLTEKELLPHRRYMHMIFQDPYASLNPRMTVADIISEPLLTYSSLNRAERYHRVRELLELVGLNQEHASRFPHEFSGGQRQRIGIARSLAAEPKFIVADEPISALDVSIQAQVVNLLEELQEKLGLTYLFIAHDLSMVKHLSDRVGVMYLGRLVELTNSAELYRRPLHPYTKALMSAIPIADPDLEKSRKRVILRGDVPSPIDPPSGCSFRTRCAFAREECRQTTPSLREVEKGHFVACEII